MTNKLASKNLFAALFTLLLAAGCNHNLYFSDDEGAPRPATSALSSHPDELSLPYVLGTQVNIDVLGDSAGTTAAWQVKSENPAVVRIDKLVPTGQDRHLQAQCTATGTGATAIRLVDDKGQEQRSATVSVQAPGQARVFAHGLLRVLDQANYAQAEVHEARVLTGGTGVFALAYFQGGQRLYGRGIATTDALAPFQVEDHTSAGGAINEWLFITPQADGMQQVHVSAAGQVLLTLPVIGVPDSAVATLDLVEQAGPKTDDNQQIWVLARTRDDHSVDIQGAYDGWTLSGAPQLDSLGDPMPASGDLYRYEFDPHGTPQPLVATHGAHTAMLPIQAHKGHVSDTTYLGCTAAPGSAAGPAGGAGLLIVLLLLTRSLARMRRSTAV